MIDKRILLDIIYPEYYEYELTLNNNKNKLFNFNIYNDFDKTTITQLKNLNEYFKLNSNKNYIHAQV